MKIDFLFADTNFLIYVHEGEKLTEPFLAFDFGISFISEVELLGYKGDSQRRRTAPKETYRRLFSSRLGDKDKRKDHILKKGI